MVIQTELALNRKLIEKREIYPFGPAEYDRG
jgi:hypothetical protein